MGWIKTIRLVNKLIGHGMEPKIFWSADAERIETEFSNPFGNNQNPSPLGEKRILKNPRG